MHARRYGSRRPAPLSEHRISSDNCYSILIEEPPHASKKRLLPLGTRYQEAS